MLILKLLFEVVLFLPATLSSSVLVSAAASNLPIPSTCPSGAPSWTSPDHTCQGPPEVYSVRSSYGRGLGVFALHDLEAGSVVMRETPILKIKPPDFIKGSGYPMAAVSRLLRTDFVLLSPAEQEEVMSLTFHAKAGERETSDQLGLIFRTNAYKTGEDIGLFPKIARINHSCRPNTSYYWNAKLNKRIVYANRNIKKGEEIFDSYISLLLTHEERQKHLAPYGFTCSCEVCATEKETLRKSDKNRVDIRKTFEYFQSQLALTAPENKTAMRIARKNAKASLQLAELVEREGLADYYATAYKIAAISHARVQDWRPATVWANKGYELNVMVNPQSPQAMEMHQLTSSFIESWKNDLKKQSDLTDKV